MSARPGWAVLTALLCGCAHGPEAKADPTLADTVTWLQPPSVSGVPYDRASLQGRVVLVSFDATWCFPCLADLPVLKKLQGDFAARGFALVEVGWDLEGEKVIRPWSDSYELNFPVLLASVALREGRTPFGHLTQLPARFLFSRDGALVVAWAGVADPADLIAMVKREVARSR